MIGMQVLREMSGLAQINLLIRDDLRSFTLHSLSYSLSRDLEDVYIGLLCPCKKLATQAPICEHPRGTRSTFSSYAIVAFLNYEKLFRFPIDFR